jgi:hypothetical protein
MDEGLAPGADVTHKLRAADQSEQDVLLLVRRSQPVEQFSQQMVGHAADVDDLQTDHRMPPLAFGLPVLLGRPAVILILLSGRFAGYA